MKPLSFFKQNIGKVIYRDDDGCDCDACKAITEHGLKIYDEQHAEYLYMTQNDYMAEGIDLKYRKRL